MSISINVTPAASGGTFTVGSTSSQNVTLEVTGGIGPPGTDVALAAGTGISIVTVDHTATISSTVVIPDNLADLSDVTLGNVTTGQVLAYNGTAWTAAADNALTLSTSAGSDLGTAAIGTSGEAARADHVHNLPTFAEITNGTASVTGNLTLNASTGVVIVNGGTAAGSLTLNCEQNTHGVTIASPAHAAGASYTLTLPATAGSANQVLTTDGSGSLSWSNGTSGGAGISWSSVPSDSNANGTAGQVAYDSQGYFYLHDGTQWRRIQLATFGVVPTERLLTETSDSLLSETGDYIAHDGNPAQITITSQPQNATTSGATAAFSITATVSDSSTITYQWQEFTGTIWADITAATSSTLTLGGLTSSDNGNQYRVNVGSDTSATVTSDVATLTVQATSNWTQVYSDIDGAAAGYEMGPVALNSAGNVAVIGEPFYDSSNANVGRMRVFRDNGTAWNQPSIDIPGAYPSEKFGSFVAISDDGNVIAQLRGSGNVGSSDAGRPARYVWSGSAWTRSPDATQTISLSTGLGTSVGWIGLAVSGNGDYLVAAYGSDGSYCYARVFDCSAGTWSEVGSGVSVNTITGQFYPTQIGAGGCSINGDGTVVAIGNGWTNLGGTGNYDSNHKSAVVVKEWTGTAWALRGTNLGNSTIHWSLTSSGNAMSSGASAEDVDGFGHSVSLSSSGNVLAVGAPYAAGGGTQRGFARVYSWSGTAWSRLGSDITGSANYDYAGWSVDLSSDGTRLAVGLRGHDGNGSNSGTTRLYDWNGSAWVQVGGDIEGDASNDYAGSFVSISGDGDRVAIGAPGNDDGGAGAGQVRVFEAT